MMTACLDRLRLYSPRPKGKEKIPAHPFVTQALAASQVRCTESAHYVTEEEVIRKAESRGIMTTLTRAHGVVMDFRAKWEEAPRPKCGSSHVESGRTENKCSTVKMEMHWLTQLSNTKDITR